jgi:lipid A 3-O-deacylase
MKRVLSAAAIAAVFAGAGGGAARADEVFLGAFAHDVDAGISSHTRETGPDIDVGYNSGPITGLRAIGRPMVYFEYLPNTQGRTSFGAIGFTWRRNLIGRIYGQIGLGGALHDGVVTYQDPNAPGISTAEMEHRLFVEDHFKAMGSRFLFHPALALGGRLSSRWAVEAVWNHFSNAGLGRNNPGMDDFGGRLVFRFGPRTR